MIYFDTDTMWLSNVALSARVNTGSYSGASWTSKRKATRVWAANETSLTAGTCGNSAELHKPVKGAACLQGLGAFDTPVIGLNFAASELTDLAS